MIQNTELDISDDLPVEMINFGQSNSVCNQQEKYMEMILRI